MKWLVVTKEYELAKKQLEESIENESALDMLLGVLNKL